MEHGTARTKVAGDDEMLRTGFHNGTPLEGGKIADSEPVDLFAPARGVAQAANGDDASSQQQMRRPAAEQQEGRDEGKKAHADQVAGGRGVAAANENYSAAPGQQQGMAAPTAGGRRLGRQ